LRSLLLEVSRTQKAMQRSMAISDSQLWDLKLSMQGHLRGSPQTQAYDEVSTRAWSLGSTPPGTGASTPSPPCIGGYARRGSGPLSNGDITPPERERLQQVMDEILQVSLKPGLIEGTKTAWSSPFPETPCLPVPVVPPSMECMPCLPDPCTPPPKPFATTPPAPLAPSVGSVGHPVQCADACKYVKRKTGCLMGSACPQCHLCFWLRKPSAVPAPSEPTKPAAPEAEGALPVGCVSAFASGKALEAENAKPAIQESLGSRGHADGCCAGACKYVRRKGGCRNGSSCLDCHLCHWRRTAPQTATELTGLGDKTMPGFSSNARLRLQRLIRLQLEASAEDPEADLFEAADDAMRFMRPPPGLEDPELLGTKGSTFVPWMPLAAR